MANSKNTVTTVPLASKLNTNRNQSQVCSTYDQMNKQNSPLFGGCIYPLHYQYQYQNSQKSLIDKFGHRWYFSGNALYQSDENNANRTFMQDFSGNYTFNQTTLDASADAGCLTPDGYIILAKKASSTSVQISSYRTNGTLVSTFTAWVTDNNWSLKSIRLVYRHGVQMLCTAEATATRGDNVLIDHRLISSYAPSINVIYLGQRTFPLHLIENGNPKAFSGINNVMVSGSGESTSPNTYPIIVSSEFWVGDTLCFGVTVLNRHQNGENVCKDYGYYNLVYVSGANAANYANVRLSLSCNVNPLYDGDVGGWEWLYRLAQGGKNITTVTNSQGVITDNIMSAPDITYSAAPNNQYLSTIPYGIFQDGTTALAMGNYSLDGYYGWTNERYNWFPMGCEGSTNFNTAGTSYVPISPRGTSLQDNVVLLPAYNTQQKLGVFALCTNNGIFGQLSTVDAQTITTNQYHYRMIVAGRSKQNGYGSTTTNGTAYMCDSMSYSNVRCMPGLLSTTTIPTTAEGWANVYLNRYINGDAFYNTTGSCTQVGKWRLLFNYREGYLSGISWNNGVSENEGTLVTPWDEVDDGFVIDTYDNSLLYKTIEGQVVLVNAVAASQDSLLANTEIIDNRYLLVKCDSPQNVYDLVTHTWGKFASDWNNRILQGFTQSFTRDDVPTVSVNKLKIVSWAAGEAALMSSWYSTGTWASGFNVAYQNTKSFSPSRLLPYVTANYVETGCPLMVGLKRESKNVYGSIEKNTLDYFCSSGTSSPVFKGSLSSISNTQASSSDDSASLQGTSYPITSSGSLYNNLPIAGVKFINSYNGRFAVQVNDKGYSMVYDGVRPVMLYNSTSIVDHIKEFFIVQSQTYAVVDSYICAVSYSSSNVINGIEQLVDVNGMEFVGSFPSVAYFYSPASRSLYAFTGDADLQLFVQTDRISTVYDHLYAPNNEWIYMTTNDGLYVLTQQNVFRIPYNELGITNASTMNMFMTDDAWNVLQWNTSGNSWSALKVRLDKPNSSWSTKPVILETEFFGKGDMKQEVIDTWYLRFFKGDEDDNGKIKVFVKTMTDIIKKTDEKTEIITPDKWDDNDNVFIRYQPQYQMTQGSSLHLESPYPVAYIGLSHQLDNTSLSHNNI